MGKVKMKIRDLVAYLNDTYSKELQALTNGTFGGPKIPEKPLTILMKNKKRNICGFYWCYLNTFASDRLNYLPFRDINNEECVAIEENYFGEYAIYSVARKEILIPTDPESSIPFSALVAILKYKMSTEDGFEAKMNSFLDTGCDDEWKHQLDRWTDPGSKVLCGIEATSVVLASIDTDEEITIRKVTMNEEVVIPTSLEAKFGGLRVASNPDEFEKAQEAIREARRKELSKEEAEKLKNSVKNVKLMDVEDEYKNMIPTEESVKDLVIVEWHYALARAINNPIRPAKNIALYGPPGSGKSTVSNWLGYKFSLAVWAPFVCCAETTAESTFGSYHFEDGKPVYELSNIMKCAKYGGIIEIQEISCIRDSGVLTALNNLFEPNGLIRIEATGEEFRRNENCYIIMTTNLNLAGCRPLNMSVLSRCAFTFYVPALTEKEYVDRVVSTQPQIKLERSYMELMATCFVNLIRTVEEDGIYGDTSFRSFLSWVAMTYVMGDPQIAADYTLIDKLCFAEDPDEKMKLRSLIENMLQKKPQNVFTESKTEP